LAVAVAVRILTTKQSVVEVAVEQEVLCQVQQELALLELLDKGLLVEIV
jgi:hypothetical protein